MKNGFSVFYWHPTHFETPKSRAMEEKIWNKLLAFETRDLTAAFIEAKHKRRASARQILEINSNFIQGKEYFRNAAFADMTVKPLLLYYGVSALSRGLILAAQPQLSEAALKPSHGLETKEWHLSLSNRDFASISIVIRQGTFSELLTATDNKSYFKHNTSGINWAVPFPIPGNGTEINFFELVQTFPDLHVEYELWRQEKLLYAVLDTLTHTEQGYFYSFPEHVTQDTIKALFPQEAFDGFQFLPTSSSNKIQTSNKMFPQFSQLFTDSFRMGIGEAVITKTIKNSIHLNSLAQYFSLSYFLGMLCRYFPSVWMCLERGGKGDAIYPLMVKSIRLIEEHFPELVFEFLSSPYDFEKRDEK